MARIELKIWYFLGYLLFWSQQIKAVIDKDLQKKNGKIYDNIECIRGENLWTYIHISAHSFLIMTLVEEDLDGDHFVSEGTKTQRNYTSCTKTLVMPETVPEVLLFCYKWIEGFIFLPQKQGTLKSLLREDVLFLTLHQTSPSKVPGRQSHQPGLDWCINLANSVEQEENGVTMNRDALLWCKDVKNYRFLPDHRTIQDLLFFFCILVPGNRTFMDHTSVCFPAFSLWWYLALERHQWEIRTWEKEVEFWCPVCFLLYHRTSRAVASQMALLATVALPSPFWNYPVLALVSC